MGRSRLRSPSEGGERGYSVGKHGAILEEMRLIPHSLHDITSDRVVLLDVPLNGVGFGMALNLQVQVLDVPSLAICNELLSNDSSIRREAEMRRLEDGSNSVTGEPRS